MNDAPYLVQLTERLAEPLRAWPTGQREAAAAYFRGLQGDDGGFVGRAGPSDLYYTAFALRGLALLDALDAPLAERAGRFVAAQQPAGLIDMVSYLSARWTLAAPATPGDDGRQEAFLAVLAAHRTADGGFAKAPGASAASTYHSFLAALCYEMLGRPVPDADRLGAFVRSRQRDDGGFAELAAMPRGSTNASAAALALAAATGSADFAMLDAACGFLLGLQRDDGGWPAGARAPGSELLSTFTALLTLADLQSLDGADLPATRRFVAACARGASFAGWPEEPTPDAEYAFYGLACTALLGPAGDLRT